MVNLELSNPGCDVKIKQLGCTVHRGKFKPVDIMVIDKTDSLVYLQYFSILTRFFSHFNNISTISNIENI